MTKTEAYKFELSGGLLTGIFGTANFLFALLANPYAGNPLNSLGEFLTAVSVFLGIPMLVAVGSYIHSVKGNFLGILMILIGAIMSVVIICGVILSLAFSSYSSLSFLMIIAPNLMAILTLLVSIVEKSHRTKPHSASTPGNLSA